MRKPRSLYLELLSVLGLVLVFLLSTVVASAFALYRNNVLKTTNQNLQATGEQLLGTYDSYFSQILRNSDSIIYSYNAIDDENKFEETMNALFSNLVSLREEIISVSLYKVSTGELIASNGSTGVHDNVKNEEWFNQTFATSEAKLIPVLNITTTQNPAYPNSFSISRYASYDKNNTFDAVLHIEFSFNAIVNLLSETALGEGGNFLIYDKNYRIVYSSLPKDLGDKISILKELVVGNGHYSISNHSYFVFASSISNTSWRLGVFLNYDAVSEAIKSFTIYISIIG